MEQQAQRFWHLWRHEYLYSLQQRKKWARVVENVQLGQLALMKSDQLPKACWEFAKIIKLRPDSEGIVRLVDLQRGNKVDTRHITKLCLLPVFAEGNVRVEKKEEETINKMIGHPIDEPIAEEQSVIDEATAEIIETERSAERPISTTNTEAPEEQKGASSKSVEAMKELLLAAELLGTGKSVSPTLKTPATTPAENVVQPTPAGVAERNGKSNASRDPDPARRRSKRLLNRGLGMAMMVLFCLSTFITNGDGRNLAGHRRSRSVSLLDGLSSSVKAASRAKGNVGGQILPKRTGVYTGVDEGIMGEVAALWSAPIIPDKGRPEVNFGKNKRTTMRPLATKPVDQWANLKREDFVMPVAEDSLFLAHDTMIHRYFGNLQARVITTISPTQDYIIIDSVNQYMRKACERSEDLRMGSEWCVSLLEKVKVEAAHVKDFIRVHHYPEQITRVKRRSKGILKTLLDFVFGGEDLSDVENHQIEIDGEIEEFKRWQTKTERADYNMRASAYKMNERLGQMTLAFHSVDVDVINFYTDLLYSHAVQTLEAIKGKYQDIEHPVYLTAEVQELETQIQTSLPAGTSLPPVALTQLLKVSPIDNSLPLIFPENFHLLEVAASPNLLNRTILVVKHRDIAYNEKNQLFFYLEDDTEILHLSDDVKVAMVTEVRKFKAAELDCITEAVLQNAMNPHCEVEKLPSTFSVFKKLIRNRYLFYTSEEAAGSLVWGENRFRIEQRIGVVTTQPQNIGFRPQHGSFIEKGAHRRYGSLWGNLSESHVEGAVEGAFHECSYHAHREGPAPSSISKECVEQILSLLDWEDMKNLSLACKTMRDSLNQYRNAKFAQRCIIVNEIADSRDLFKAFGPKSGRRYTRTHVDLQWRDDAWEEASDNRLQAFHNILRDSYKTLIRADITSPHLTHYRMQARYLGVMRELQTLYLHFTKKVARKQEWDIR